MMTSVAAKLVFEAARSVNYFRMEDVFVGMCFRKAGVDLVDEPRFGLSKIRMVENPCDVHHIFTHHGVRFNNLWLLKLAQDDSKSCIQTNENALDLTE